MSQFSGPYSGFPLSTKVSLNVLMSQSEGYKSHLEALLSIHLCVPLDTFATSVTHVCVSHRKYICCVHNIIKLNLFYTVT